MSLNLDTERAEVNKATTSALSKSISSLLSSEKYSDLVIKCKGHIFNVHRAIVCTQSPPLAAMMDGPWKEAATGEIDLEDDEPETVKLMINFMYTRSYECAVVPEPQASPRAEPPTKRVKRSKKASLFKTHAKLYVIGDKYCIASLKKYACHEYTELAFALSSKDYGDFLESVGVIYENTMESDRAMKDMAIHAMCAKREVLRERPDFKLLLKNHHEIGIDFVHHISDSDKSCVQTKKKWLILCDWDECDDVLNCACGAELGFYARQEFYKKIEMKYDVLAIASDQEFQCVHPRCGLVFEAGDLTCATCTAKNHEINPERGAGSKFSYDDTAYVQEMKDVK